MTVAGALVAAESAEGDEISSLSFLLPHPSSYLVRQPLHLLVPQTTGAGSDVRICRRVRTEEAREMSDAAVQGSRRCTYRNRRGKRREREGAARRPKIVPKMFFGPPIFACFKNEQGMRSDLAPHSSLISYYGEMSGPRKMSEGKMREDPN